LAEKASIRKSLAGFAVGGAATYCRPDQAMLACRVPSAEVKARV
jgi:hypothetical protein